MATLLVCSDCDSLEALTALFAEMATSLAPDLKLAHWPAKFDADDVIAVAAWHPPQGLLSKLPNLRMVASVGAGVDHILRCIDLPENVAITRIVDQQQLQGMSEYVLWAVLYFHRGFNQVMQQQASCLWRIPPQTTAANFRVGILGLGSMGLQVAKNLRGLGYSVSGWSRSGHQVTGLRTYAGNEQLGEFLEALDLVVCLLPLTDLTVGLCDAAFFARMKFGAFLVNVGRGEQVITSDLIAALDSGQLGGVVLDVFENEPLPIGNAIWRHPRIFVTPHMASSPSNQIVALQILGNVQRLLQGLPPNNTVDRGRGY